LWISLALIAASVFIYAGVRNHDFVAWDDPEYVNENLHVTAGLTWEGARYAFTTGHMGNWHPLTWLSYMLGVQLFGPSAAPQLLINLLLHILNTLLLFGLLHKITGALGRSAFVAALFATHPLHVESVAWVSERKDVLSTLIGLLALWAYVEYTRLPGRIRYLAVLLLFALALMSKPMLVTLPLVMLLLDYWPLRRISLQADAQDRPGLAPAQQRHIALQLVREKLPMLAVAMICGLITLVTQRSAGAVTGLTQLPLNLRVANALVSYTAYIGKMLWPANLSALYPLSPLLPVAVLGSGLALIVVSLAAIREGRRHPYLLVGWMWYLVALAPVIGLIQVGSQSMADRYTYVPLIGLFIVLAWGIPDLIPRWRFREFMLPAAAGILVLGCAITARAQAEYWKDTMTLWAHALEVTSDNDIAHNLLGDALAKHGRAQEAVAHYSEALRIKPDNAEAHNGLGLALANQGRWSEALTNYSEAVRLKPAFVDAHSNMGIALASQGRIEEAIGQYSEALRINPEFATGHNDLGVALANQGKTSEAVFQFSEVLRLRPDDPDAENNLGILLASQGMVDEAIAHFDAAVRLNPGFELARNNLKVALAKREAATK
jgi:protein O-mannosyl-transferase